jgi:ethanolamine ammonia-lyase large subunit
MSWKSTAGGLTFRFGSLAELLAKANEQKSGDELAGIAALSERERVAAKLCLADTRLSDIVDTPLVEDEVTQATAGYLDRERFQQHFGSLTVGELREQVLTPGFPRAWGEDRLGELITPEVAAAVAKVMSNLDLMHAASRLHVITRCRTTIGEPGVLASRIQPNHPEDDPEGITYSIIDGLMRGSGDALIGINPAIESVDTVTTLFTLLQRVTDALSLPTQGSVLAHATTQLAALGRGATVDLFFQSVAGTQAANTSFGINLGMLEEAHEATLQAHARDEGRYAGANVMYFETGQGSALSADAHHGIDQLTCEARAQAVARLYDPFLVNSVVGFIGPEYLANAGQIARAGLEDHFVGKLMGLPMGCDVCYTNHVDADQNSNDNLLVLLAAAGCNFVMGVPAGDDIMLGYQSTSFHDVATTRSLLQRRPTPDFERWLSKMGLSEDGQRRSLALTSTVASLGALVGQLPGAGT